MDNFFLLHYAEVYQKALSLPRQQVEKRIPFHLGIPCEPVTVPAAVILANPKHIATANTCGKAF